MHRGLTRLAVVLSLGTTLVSASLPGAMGAAGRTLPTTASGPVGHVAWTTWGKGLQRQGYNPSETTLTPATAPDLQELWTTRNLGAVIDTSPVLAPGVQRNGRSIDLLYVGTEHGTVVALNAATGTVIWSRDLGSEQTGCPDSPDGVSGVTGSPVIDRSQGRLYVAGGDARLYALELATGATEPGWPVTLSTDPVNEHVWTALTLVNGHVYTGIASHCDVAPYRGRLIGVDTSTRKVVRWWTLGRSGPDGGGIWGWGGAASDGTGDLFVATGNALGPQENVPYGESVVRLSPTLAVEAAHTPALDGFDGDFGGHTVLFQPSGCPPMLAVQRKYGTLLLYKRDSIADGPMQTFEVTDRAIARFIGAPAWDPETQSLYVSVPATSTDGTVRHGEAALVVRGDCTIGYAPASGLGWNQQVGNDWSVMSPPTVAGGVVYMADGPAKQLHAFDAVTGAPLWDSGTAFDGPVFAAPVVVNGMVYASSWDHRVHAFGLPPPSFVTPSSPALSYLGATAQADGVRLWPQGSMSFRVSSTTTVDLLIKAGRAQTVSVSVDGSDPVSLSGWSGMRAVAKGLSTAVHRVRVVNSTAPRLDSAGNPTGAILVRGLAGDAPARFLRITRSVAVSKSLGAGQTLVLYARGAAAVRLEYVATGAAIRTRLNDAFWLYSDVRLASGGGLRTTQVQWGLPGGVTKLAVTVQSGQLELRRVLLDAPARWPTPELLDHGVADALPRLAVFGDSLAAGGLTLGPISNSDGYSSRLGALRGDRVVNESAGGLSAAPPAAADAVAGGGCYGANNADEVVASDPDVVIVAFGLFNMLPGPDGFGCETTLEEFRADMDSILSTLQSGLSRTPVYVASILPTSLADDDTRATWNQVLQDESAKFGDQYVDLSGILDRATDAADAIHLNNGGHAKLAAAWAEILDSG